MKSLTFILVMLFFTAPCMAMNETQAAWLEGVHLGMTFGHALEAATLSGNNTEYNILAQKYNDEINASLPEDEAKKEWLALKPSVAIPKPSLSSGVNSGQSVIGTKKPFNSSSSLGQFGKQQVYDSSIYSDKEANQAREMDEKNRELENFLNS
jgi:hypothetical protein